ncbi:MAG: hypothetical protein ACRCYU_22680 [Nocardioides sp.]
MSLPTASWLCTQLVGKAALVKQGVWHQGSVKLGVASLYRLSDPVDVPVSTWPTARWIDGKAEYEVIEPKWGVRRLRSFVVLTDLRSKKVASVEPDEYDRLVGIELTGIDTTVQEMGGAGR